MARALPTQHTIFRAPLPPPRALPSREEIVANLDDDDVTVAGSAVADLIEAVARGGDVDADEIARVRRLLARHRTALPALLLARIVALLLRGGDHDHDLVIEVAAEVVEVGDEEDQLELVHAFQILGEGAPRTSAAMRDTVWPKLGGRALFVLLDDSDDDDDGEDDPLWALVATRIQEEDRPALEARLARRAATRTPWHRMRDVVDAVVDGMAAIEAAHRRRVEAEAGASIDVLLAGLGHADLHRLTAFIAGLATTTTTPTLDAERADAFAADVGRLAGTAPSWPSLTLLTRHLHRLALPDTPRQRILAQLLGIAVRDDDDDGITLVMALLPAVVDNAILAFNLACRFARSGDRRELLRWTRRALDLGKPAAQFRDDSDFDPWRDDVEFAAVLAAH